jgi:cytoskeletal protein RodZ
LNKEKIPSVTFFLKKKNKELHVVFFEGKTLIGYFVIHLCLYFILCECGLIIRVDVTRMINPNSTRLKPQP